METMTLNTDTHTHSVMGAGFSPVAALAVVMAPAGIAAAILARAGREYIR